MSPSEEGNSRKMTCALEYISMFFYIPGVSWEFAIVRTPPLAVTPQNTWTNSGRFEPYRHTTSFFCMSIFLKPAAAESISDSSWAKFVCSPVIPCIYQGKKWVDGIKTCIQYWTDCENIILVNAESLYYPVFIIMYFPRFKRQKRNRI